MNDTCHPYSGIARRLIRRGVRMVLRSAAPAGLRELAARVPFSRYQGVAAWLFGGREVIDYRGVRIEVNPGDLLGYYAYFLDDYAGQEIQKLIELCGAGQVLADVGANLGWVSAAVAHACPSLTVFAFEPSREIAEGFRANLARNPHLGARVHLVEKAVGDSDGWVEFRPSPNVRNPGTGRVVDARGGAGAYRVPVVRLDSFFRDALWPDVVKIDVEGAELDVLRGMTRLFTAGFPKAVLVETHAFYFPERAAEFNGAIVAELECGGFSLLRSAPQGWAPLRGTLGPTPRTHLLGVRIDRHSRAELASSGVADGDLGR